MEQNEDTVASTERNPNQKIEKEEDEDLEIDKKEEPLKDDEIVNLFKNIKFDSKDLPSLVKDFSNFNEIIFIL